MDDFMLDVIPVDFDVKIFLNQEDACLFYGFKKGYVHFVKYYDNYVIQYHIPRFIMAKSFEFLFRTKYGVPEMPLFDDINDRFRITKHSIEKFTFEFGRHSFTMEVKNNEDFFSKVKKDVKLYKKAMKQIMWEENTCFLEKLKSVKGKSLESKDGNDDLLTAIAFENQIFKDLSAKKQVSIYSLYSKMIDGDTEISSNEFMAMAESLNEFLSEERNEEINEIYYNVLDKGVFINFQEDEAVEVGNYADVILFAYRDLKTPQKIQFKELYERHRFFFIVPLAFATGIIDEFQYNDIVNKGFQPDSHEEQKIRYETSVAVAFGNFLNSSYQGLEERNESV